MRVKCFDGNPKTGNCEVFAEVVATRLFRALGFDADAMVSAAIDALPPRADKDRQRKHFDALALLAIFVQHGDRKPSQQRPVCSAPLDATRGDLRAEDDGDGFQLPLLVEHDGATACSSSRLTVQDLGATLGGAGFITNARSKVQLASWAKTNVRPGPRVASGTCRGQIGIALGAGSKAGGNLGIGAAGRQFLFERLSPLTPACVRTLWSRRHVSTNWVNHSSGRMPPAKYTPGMTAGRRRLRRRPQPRRERRW